MKLLHDLYVNELRDLYNAENQLLTVLPKMARAAQSAKLSREFADHLEETEQHVERLVMVFDGLGLSPEGKKCQVMEGLLAAVQETIEDESDPTVRDAALISAAQRVELFEMAGYRCACRFARSLGYEAVADLMQESFNEEFVEDQNLTALAQSEIHLEAAPQVSWH